MAEDASRTLPARSSRPGAVRRAAASGVPAAVRVFFGVIAAAALFVAYLGLFFPGRLDRSFTWAILPPLHARFVAVLYLFGGVYMIGCLLARRWSQVSPALAAIGLFTSLLLLVTLLNLEAFDFDLGPVWVWTVSYIVYPAIAFALAWALRRRAGAVPRGPALPRWATAFLMVQAAAFAVLGVLLLVARDLAVDVWPWTISPGLAQFYGGPFLAYAFCSWRYGTRRQWAELGAIAPAMLVFTAGTVIVSLAHRDLFSASDVTAWVWFGAFGAAAAILLVMTARSVPAALADRRKSRN
jgi:hypothetical protein